MRTPAGYQQYAAAHLHRPDGGNWATPTTSDCVGLVFNAGGFSRSFTTATLAGNHVADVHGLDANPATAMVGEFDYWTDHIALRTATGDLMASQVATSLAPGLGYLTYQRYGQLEPKQHYRGHSPFFGDETLATEIDPSQLRQSGDSMLALEFTDPPIAGWKFLLAPGYIKNAPLTQADEYALMTGQTIQSVNLAAMTDQLWNHGFAPLLPKGQADVVAFLQSLTGGAFKVASWLTATGTTSLQPVLDQLAAIDKLEASDEAALITAINALPAAVRSKIIAP